VKRTFAKTVEESRLTLVIRSMRSTMKPSKCAEARSSWCWTGLTDDDDDDDDGALLMLLLLLLPAVAAAESGL